VTDARLVSEFSEEQLIARIANFLTILDDVELGPGDDAAVVGAPDGRVVVSTDVLVEGRHFLRNWISAPDLGRRAMAQNLADIAAMGARPTAVVVALTIPGDLPVTWLEDLARGMGQACLDAGTSLAGGDLCRGDHISIAVTALGSLDGAAPVLRSGARAGDILAHAGSVGWSAAGFALLEDRAAQPERPFEARAGVSAEELMAAHRVPQPPLRAGIAAQQAGASAMLDVSDGLLRDAGRIAAASNVVLDLDEAAIAAWEESLREAAEHVGASGRDWVLSGGEDHGLLATFPSDATLPGAFTAIGRVLATAGEPGVLISGQPTQIPPGWDHFSG